MAPRRSPMQDWTCFPLYLSGAVWNLLQHTQGQLQKIDGLADYLICELGLRNPSEMTMATVAALLSMHDPNGQAVRASAQQMYALLQTCRSRFKAVVARARAASREIVVYVQHLPSNTSRLPAQLVQARFPQGFSPVQVDLQELSRHARAWPLRETNSLVRGQSTQQVPGTGSDALVLLQQAATVFRAMGMGPRSPRVPVEPNITFLPSTATGSQLQPVAANGPVASLALPPSSAGVLSLQLPAQGRLAQQGAVQQLQATPSESAQTDSFESQATVPATDSQLGGPSSRGVPARASGLQPGEPADAARAALLARQQRRRAADWNSCAPRREAGQSPCGVRGRVGCRALWQKAAAELAADGNEETQRSDFGFEASCVGWHALQRHASHGGRP